MKGALVILLALMETAAARPQLVEGTVISTRSAWAGDAIVTTSELRTANDVTTVVQLGGSVDGIGMTFSHQPGVLQPGDVVSLTTEGAAITSVRALTTPVGGTARYGIQRTSRSHVAVWRDSSCLQIAYDADSVSTQTAAVLDAAFRAWASGTAQCGAIEITTTREHGVPAEIDGVNAVHIRTDRWCRPATETTPELCYSPEAAAVTRLIYVDSPGSLDDGKILEADIDFNAVGFALVRPGETAPSTTNIALYLRAVATHEVGHLLGLAHECGTGAELWPTDHAGAAVPACDGDLTGAHATMFYAIGPLDDGPSTLEQGDIAGACAIVKELACVAEVSGGCSSGRGDAGGAGLLVGLWILRRRKRT